MLPELLFNILLKNLAGVLKQEKFKHRKINMKKEAKLFDLCMIRYTLRKSADE